MSGTLTEAALNLADGSMRDEEIIAAAETLEDTAALIAGIQDSEVQTDYLLRAASRFRLAIARRRSVGE